MAEEKKQASGSDSVDLSLSAIIQALDEGTPMAEAQDPALEDAFDPNATMNYQEAGVSYPELPFADEENSSVQSGSARSQKRAADQADEMLADKSLKSRSSAAGQSAETLTGATTRAARRSMDMSEFDNVSSNYRPVTARQSGYKIRGGGGRKFNSPILIALCAVLVIVGAGVMIYTVNNLINSLSSTSNEVGFELTATETRSAIDSRIPTLIDYIDYGIEDATAALSESQFIYTNDRYSPNNPDVTAVNTELVSMPNEMSTEQMEGYYSGEYNAYSIEELSEYFNGAYVLDLARGDLGNWNKLKYINLTATSIEDEMSHLADVQGLTGDTVTITAQGADSQGNLVIQGQKVLEGERILYFKIAACPFNEIYNAESIGSSSVFISCTIATYDFYTGYDEITPVEE